MGNRQHRDTRMVVVFTHKQRQRPEMRRRPHKCETEHQHRFDGNAACSNRPTDHRRKCASSAANHDILWCPAFQPHRVDHNVEEYREPEKRACDPIRRKSEHDRGKAGQRETKTKRFAFGHFTRRDRTLLRALHHRVDVRVPPHIQRTRGTAAYRNEQEGCKDDHRMNWVGRGQ